MTSESFPQLTGLLYTLKLELNKKQENTSKNPEWVMNLSTDVDEQLSDLWDISAEPEVADRLCQDDLLATITTLLGVSQKPRLLEILVGIVGNLACQPNSRLIVSECLPLRESLLQLLTSRDAHVLVELLRLLRTIVLMDYTMWCSLWETEFLTTEGFESLISLLATSTNSTLLGKAAEFLAALLDKEESVDLMGQSASSGALTPALVEAIQQCGHDHEATVSYSLLQCLQLMTTSESGLSMLAVGVEDVVAATITCVAQIDTGGDVGFLESVEISALLNTLSIWNCFLSQSDCYLQLMKHDKVVKAALTLCKELEERDGGQAAEDETLALIGQQFAVFTEAFIAQMMMREGSAGVEAFRLDLSPRLLKCFSVTQS